jgi:hypothetical protein
MCEDFAPNFGDKRTVCCITTTYRLKFILSPGIFFTKNNMTTVHHTHIFFDPPLKIKLKGRHFDTIEVIETEPQSVLNIFREHELQDTFKSGRSSGNVAYARKEA